MSKPYDASTKFLVEKHLLDWLPLSRRNVSGPTSIIDADLSTITASADKVVRVEGEQPWIFHLELQSSWEKKLSRRIYKYNTLLEDRHDAPVHSMMVLLRREADSPNLTGVDTRHFLGEEPYRWFKFQVVRIWQMPVDQILHSGLGLLPMAPLCDDAEDKIPSIIAKLEERFSKEGPTDEIGTLWTAIDVLMGLRYSREVVAHVLKGVSSMEESVTYQAIIEKGIEKGLVKGKREVLFRQGKTKFGPAPTNIVQIIESEASSAVLDDWSEKMLFAESWQDLIDKIKP